MFGINKNIFYARTSIFCLFTFVCLCYGPVCCELSVISDKSVISISLENYNVNEPDGESLELMYLVKPDSKCLIKITSIPHVAQFVVLQVHSYLKNITLSYNPEPTRSTSVSGTNVGLIKTNVGPSLDYYLSYSNSDENATVMLTVQAYGMEAPVPGGCNMEFQVETSPFLKTKFDHAITEIEFAPASPGFSVNRCSLVPDPVTYKMYRMYLPERNYSQDLYFNSLKLMMTKGRILKNGRNIQDRYGLSLMRYSFASYPGTGSFFVVIAETENGSSVYVPSFTYSCYIDKKINDCRILTTTFSKLLCSAIFFLGLFACFAAHRFFKIQLVLLGFLSGAVPSYIAALSFHSPDPLPLAVGVGFLCGACFLVVLCFRGLPLFSLIVATSVLGYIIASLIFYKLVDVFDAFQSDINYWSLFCSIVLLAPILMISLTEKANIIACSVVGSYASVLALDYYIGSNLRYIIINTIRRATVPRFRHAVIDPPFQTKDIVLASVWATLAIAGITVQLLLMQGRPPYPAPCHPFRNIIRRYKERFYANKPATETSPLLRSNRSGY